MVKNTQDCAGINKTVQEWTRLCKSRQVCARKDKSDQEQY